MERQVFRCGVLVCPVKGEDMRCQFIALGHRIGIGRIKEQRHKDCPYSPMEVKSQLTVKMIVKGH